LKFIRQLSDGGAGRPFFYGLKVAEERPSPLDRHQTDQKHGSFYCKNMNLLEKQASQD
jgi:hypothetical protein